MTCKGCLRIHARSRCAVCLSPVCSRETCSSTVSIHGVRYRHCDKCSRADVEAMLSRLVEAKRKAVASIKADATKQDAAHRKKIEKGYLIPREPFALPVK